MSDKNTAYKVLEGKNFVIDNHLKNILIFKETGTYQKILCFNEYLLRSGFLILETNNF